MAHTEPLRVVDLAPGTRVRDWTVTEHIADGGSASAYKADYVGIADRFHPKAVLRISGALGPSRARATIAAYNRAPDSPHVIAVHHLFEWSQGETSHLVFVLEEADYTLADLLSRRCLTPDEGYDMVRQTGLGLDSYHRAGQVHGDVKPSNIMFSQGHWKLGDHAGAAPVRDDGESTAATVHESSLAYRPPESFDDPSKAHRHGDIWALAIVAHESVSGHQPFATRRQQMLGPYDISPDLGPDLADFIRDALSFDPNKRPARQAGDLEFVESSGADSKYSQGPADSSVRSGGSDSGLPTKPGSKQSRRLLLVGLAVMVILVGVGWKLATGGADRAAIAISPIVVTSETQPLFRWTAVPGAVSYQVFVNQYGDNQENGRIDRSISTVDADCAEGDECVLRADVELEGSFEWWVTTVFEDGEDLVNEGSLVAIEPVKSP